MTSKGLFFKAMAEDLRHKLWMVALSVLASFLVHPVVWLIARNNLRGYREALAAEGISMEMQARSVLAMCGKDALAFGGIVAVAGAMIVGMFGFRYLFHKNSVDLYHSLPVRRDTLFAVCYLNGFIIWFIPFLICILLSAAIWGSSLGTDMSFDIMAELVKVTGYCILFSAVIFFLVYHLVLAAVMLSGNILNTLAGMLTLGIGPLILWMLVNNFFDTYMNTFSGRSWGLHTAVYSSPLILAPTILYSVCSRPGREWMEAGTPWEIHMLSVSLAATVLLGLCAWLLYRKRASEHAEQGIRNRAASVIMRCIVGLTAGMCGWIIFALLTGEDTLVLVWSCFGAILAGGLAFGVMDIIFHMEFKAFFAHKLQMAGTLSLLLLVCFAFYFDWFGYDDYLPAKEAIAEMAVYDYRFSNRHFYSSEDSAEYPLENIKIQDTEIIYPFLEFVTDWQRSGREGMTDAVRFQYISTKVTLKNGRSYYRSYPVPEAGREVLLPLLTSEEYIRHTYLVDEAGLEGADGKLMLVRGDRRYSVEKAEQEILRSIVRAYDQDLLETPEKGVIGRGRLLTRVWIGTAGDVVLDVYDSMERTVEALEQAGFGDWIRVESASGIKSLEMGLEHSYSGSSSVMNGKEELVIMARLTYGIYGGATRAELEGRLQEIQAAYGEEEEYGALYIGEYGEQAGEWAEDAEVFGSRSGEWASLSVTDQEEIEELLELISYETPERGANLFREEYVGITIVDTSGNRQAGYIQKGKLPEKYIYRFGEIKY